MFSQLLKTNLMSETTVSQAQPAFQMFEFSSIKANNRSTRFRSGVFITNFEFIWQIALVCFLLTLNM